MEWLLETRIPKPIPVILNRAEELLGLDKRSAQALVSYLTELHLIEPSFPSGDSAATLWEERGWRDALDFQLASRGLKWEQRPEKPPIKTIRLDTRVVSEPLPDLLSITRAEGSRHAPIGPMVTSQECSKGFFDVLFSRRTFRAFRGEEVDWSKVAAMLAMAFGLPTRPDGTKARPFVTYASRFPFGIYLAALRVRDLPVGIYEYAPQQRCLKLLRSELAEEQLTSLAFGMKGVGGVISHGHDPP